MIPGEYFIQPGLLEGNAGRTAIELVVINTGDRPVQVGSHFHFFEVNRQLAFDRAKAFGCRLDIPAGTAVRFEPGEQKSVKLVRYTGAGEVHGFSGLVSGSIDTPHAAEKALEQAIQQGFKTIGS